jgi:hypothetical protein
VVPEDEANMTARLEFSRAEEWRPIPGWPYEASSNGRIRHAVTKRVRAPYFRKSDGYFGIGLCDSHRKPRQKTFPVHRLVLEAFTGPLDCDVNHIDGVKTNNHLSNLERTTPSKNGLHAYRLGLSKPQRGEDNGQCKLTDATVQEIIKRYRAGGIQQKELAEEYAISRAQMCNILNGRRRLNVSA